MNKLMFVFGTRPEFIKLYPVIMEARRRAYEVTVVNTGDRDIQVRGYLSLDPRRYSNPMLSLGLPMLFIALGGIGLPGAAVYLRTSFMTAAQFVVDGGITGAYVTPL